MTRSSSTSVSGRVPGVGGAWPTATTRVVALLGHPVGHSLSPTMHNAAFAALELDLVYVALPTPPLHLGAVVGALATVGAVGANVTVPHKEAVVALCDRVTREAELIGAVNTLFWDADGLVGDNTDAAGLGSVLRDDLGVDRGVAVVVLGTGGAARAAMAALGRAGAHVTVVGRRPDAADDLADLAETCGAAGVRGVDLADGADVSRAVGDADLVVNATPLGLDGESLPPPFMALEPRQTALDLIYNPPDTPFLRAAHEAGAPTRHGLGMLVAQASTAFERWTGQPAPTHVLSAVAAAALHA